MESRKPSQWDLLHQIEAGTPMGTLLRRFWQPVALSSSIAKGAARPLKVMGEELTLYRGESGAPHLVGGRCAHRGTVMHTGWVQGEQLRCMYHGWRYDPTGLVTEIPAEKQPRAKPLRIAGYPLHEYCGVVFAWMADEPAPEFQLPRKLVLEEPGKHNVPLLQVWDCNWFQQIENSLDAVHVSFVHTWGRSTRFDQGITTSIPDLSYEETSSGVRQYARRSADNVRVSDWTFPNNNHVVVPGPKKGDPWSDTVVWAVPIDEGSSLRFTIRSFHPSMGEQARQVDESPDRDWSPVADQDNLYARRFDPIISDQQFITVQDYIAVRGQGTIADRANENLSTSDAGILFLRKVFMRELELIREGRPTKQWMRLADEHHLPVPKAEAAADA
jgi:phenylpropionate dioxygenase-like ring-hydroxylating dioxygenase large terminal subunit